MRKQKILSAYILFITFVIGTIILLFSTYEPSAEKSSVSYDELDSRRLDTEFVTYHEIADSQQNIVQYSILYTSNFDVTPTPSVNRKESEIKTFSADLDKSNEIIYTDKEIEILQRVTEAEVTSGDIKSKCNVVSVIINRTKSSSFPDTIKDVVFQEHQFSSVSDNRYYEVEITKDTEEAVNNVLENGVTTEALYFFNLRDIESSKVKRWIDNKLDFLFKDDVGHSFYIEKE
jgi:N-acetylmuramoyl-L-alanine amidase